MTEYTFHKDIYLPDDLNQKFDRIKLKWSSHAEQQLKRYADWELPKIETFAPDKFQLIEVTINTDNPKYRKHLYRGNLINGPSVAYVINNYGLVLTTWANDRDDHHKTLDTSKYMRNPNDRTKKAEVRTTVDNYGNRSWSVFVPS